jgi:hypothetical protein
LGFQAGKFLINITIIMSEGFTNTDISEETTFYLMLAHKLCHFFCGISTIFLILDPGTQGTKNQAVDPTLLTY